MARSRNSANLVVSYHSAIELKEGRELLKKMIDTDNPDDCVVQAKYNADKVKEKMSQAERSKRELSQAATVEMLIESLYEAAYLINPEVLDCLHKRICPNDYDLHTKQI